MKVEDDDERQQLTVVVLDDRPVVGLGVRAALADLPEAAGVLVVGRVPDVVEAVRSAAQRGRVVVLLLDDADHPARAAAALDAGACGVVSTASPIAELVDVVRRASRGGAAVSGAVAARLDELASLQQAFTPREQEVLRLYGSGLPAKSVARRMGVQQETVKTYLKRLREKAGRVGVPTQTRVELAALARRLDLL